MSRNWEFWTDGSHITQETGSSAGWAFVGFDLDRRKYVIYGPGGTTNNQGELIAIYRVVELMNQIGQSGDSVTIYTDSQLSVKTFTEWIRNWKRNGWKSSTGAPVKNQEIIQPIEKILDQLAQKNIRVNFVHIAAHAGIENNELADRYANLGRTSTEIKSQLL